MAGDDSCRMGVFAKQPVIGHAKTRLAKGTSDPWALCVADAFLRDSLDRFSAIDARRAIVFAPDSALAFFSEVSQGRYDLMPQGDGNLGQRLSRFFGQARREGYSRIIAAGVDSPTLPIAYIDQAFDVLKTHDAVIGPACDGGYYLIGSGPKDLAMFEEIPWSTPRVLEATVARLAAASARIALLPPWYDIDTADDWTMLRGHILAMRLAGIDPGVPRVERLVQELTS